MKRLLYTEALEIGYRQPGKAVRRLLEPLSAELNAGELVCLLGPNGSGKSTLLRTLAGMQAPLTGTIWLEHQKLTAFSAQERARQLAIVLTERVPLGPLTVAELVALGRTPYTNALGWLTLADRQAIEQALQIAGVEALRERHVDGLSDGERQKVMIARALAQEARVLLLDEPTAFLDLPRRVEIMQRLRELARQTQRAILLSTHDLDLALRAADRIWLLETSGAWTLGAPEDLILQGAFARAFASEGALFDAATGSFKMLLPKRGEVGWQGEGLIFFWTAHALEREGFEVVPLSPKNSWNLTFTDSPTSQWHLKNSSGMHQTLASLAELSAALKMS